MAGIRSVVPNGVWNVLLAEQQNSWVPVGLDRSRTSEGSTRFGCCPPRRLVRGPAQADRAAVMRTVSTNVRPPGPGAVARPAASPVTKARSSGSR